METPQLIMLPGPTNVPPRVMRAMLKPIINHRDVEFREMYKRIIENSKYVFQTKSDIFVLSSSGTGGVECAIANIVSNGDKIIVPVNGVFSQRVKETIECFGGKPIEILVEWGKAVTVEQIKEAIEKEKDVRAVAIVYNETSTGVTTRILNEVGKICKENDILFIVDAISILGGDYLPVDDWNVDICIAGSQKCLMCPPGLALISVSEKAWSIIEKTTKKKYYFDLNKYREFQEKYETPFTPVLPLFYALDEALQMIKEEGLEARFKRHRVCAQAFYEGIKALELKPFADESCRSNVVIAINNPSNISDKDIREIMRKKYKIAIAGGMGKLKGTMFRVGVMGTVSSSEILFTLSALELTLSELGYRLKLGDATLAAKEVFSKEGL
ncbi:MAG: alanine--glyoxylate aminotransferase family protein [Candidatus Bathyarchaeia archaeon]